MRKRSDEQQSARIRLSLGGTKPIQVHTVRKTDNLRVAGYQRAIFFRHCHHAVHSTPRFSLKTNPARQLPAQLPIVPLPQQLLVKIQRYIVLHQNSFGRRAIGRILGHLSKLELRQRRFPLANRLAQRGMECG